MSFLGLPHMALSILALSCAFFALHNIWTFQHILYLLHIITHIPLFPVLHRLCPCVPLPILVHTTIPWFLSTCFHRVRFCTLFHHGHSCLSGSRVVYIPSFGVHLDLRSTVRPSCSLFCFLPNDLSYLSRSFIAFSSQPWATESNSITGLEYASLTFNNMAAIDSSEQWYYIVSTQIMSTHDILQRILRDCKE